VAEANIVSGSNVDLYLAELSLDEKSLKRVKVSEATNLFDYWTPS
jgi:hypothetical protein